MQLPMANERKVILFIAMSLDGYIAKPSGEISFLSLVEKENEDYGYNEFLKNIDAIIIGRKTYDKVKSMGFEYPHDDKNVYIISRTRRPNDGALKYYSGNLKDLVVKLKKESGKNVYCDGGSEIVNELLNDNLIDEFIISIIPIILGDGIPLFKKRETELKLKLIGCKHYEKGLVQLHYVREEV
jgi:dihydrofolate reductase